MLVKDLIAKLQQTDPTSKVRVTNETWDIMYSELQVGIDKDTRNIIIMCRELNSVDNRKQYEGNNEKDYRE